MPAARRKLGTGNPGKVVPGSSLIHLRNTVWCQAPRVQCSEQSCPSGGAPAPGLQETPAVAGRVGGAQEGVPCDSIRSCHWEGFLSSIMSYDSPKLPGKDPAGVHFAGGFVSILGPQH